MRVTVFLFFLVLLLFSCRVSQKTLDQHEAIRANLKEYENDAFYQANYSDTTFTDFVALDYHNYRKKYNLSRRHMEIVALTSETAVSILKANRAIEKANQLRDSIQSIGRIDTSKLNFSSFEKIIPL